ncbi:MAG: acyltransferase, partial [Pseudomonadota bacterium]
RRILPGLLVCLLLSVLVLGPLMTTLPLGVYLTDPDTWRFLLVNGSLLGFRADLPGVFAGNPFPAAAGSIWTLSHEIACYAGIAVLGASGVLARRSVATAALSLALVAALLLPGSGLAVPGRVALFSEMAVPFAVGALFCLWRDRILLAPIGVLGLAVAAFVSAGSALYDAVLPVALVYGTLTLGFGPWASRFGHWIRHDYSYGVYIYAFPVQGLVVASAGPMGPWMNIALALPPTLVLAALSWHCVEKPMMTRKPFRAPIAMSDERAIRSD